MPDEADPVSILEQQQNDAAYRALLAQGVLAVLLPTEDLRNPCLRALVSDIFADLILGNFLSIRICDPQFLYESIRKAAEIVQPKVGIQRWAFDKRRSEVVESKNRLAQFGLLSERKTASTSSVGDVQRTISEWFWTIAQYIYLAFTSIRLCIKLFTTDIGGNGTSEANASAKVTPSGTIFPMPPQKRVMIDLKLWPALANTINLSAHMPWLAGCIALAQHFLLHGPGRVSGLNSRLDR